MTTWWWRWCLSVTIVAFSSSIQTAVVRADETSASLDSQPPNIIFLVVESTDGRTWRRGYQDDVIPLPNLRRLEDMGGTSFYSHYCNSPVCCPSRASFWSGRYPHKIPHLQQQEAGPSSANHRPPPPRQVNGVWNNFEGLDQNYTDKLFDVLARHGYEVYLSGKEDYTTGSHTLTTRLNSWTMYTPFPYNLSGIFPSSDSNNLVPPATEPWAEEGTMCRGNGTVDSDDSGPSNMETSAHLGDWVDLNATLDWIRYYHAEQQEQLQQDQSYKPFFVYQGMNIVHPPYHTNQYWYDKIDPSKIQTPYWPDFDDPPGAASSPTETSVHPCDFQSSMLKGCFPINTTTLSNTEDSDDINFVLHSKERRRNIRRIYYAMVAEFDAMVGRYISTIMDELVAADNNDNNYAGDSFANNTVFIVTSDHGDMQMEHTQFYKMSPYDASSAVPLIIYDPRRKATTTTINDSEEQSTTINRVVRVPTQHVDLFPTIMELAGICLGHKNCPKDVPVDLLDGYSLLPFLDDDNDDTFVHMLLNDVNDNNGDYDDDQTLVLPHDPDDLEEPPFPPQVVDKRGGNKRRNLRHWRHHHHYHNITRRPPYAVTQYHGDDSPMSWFLIVQPFACKNTTQSSTASTFRSMTGKPMCMYKLVIWGTGEQVDSQLFDLTNDPDEWNNLIHDPKYAPIALAMERNLNYVVPYQHVAKEVAQYNVDSFETWKKQNAQNWTDIISQETGLRWHASWQLLGNNRSIDAIEEWLTQSPPAIQGCRREVEWPPKPT